MPNWNYNEVTVDAPAIEVQKFLIFDNEEYRFNMHKIFPEVFPSTDTIGDENWDYNWACDNTGSKWFPGLDGVMAAGDDQSYISYDTAWAPNNLLLQKLSEITGWKIENIYEEPGMSFEGTFICKAWKVLAPPIVYSKQPT